MKKDIKPGRRLLVTVLGTILWAGTVSGTAYAGEPFARAGDSVDASGALAYVEGAPYVWNVAVWGGTSMIPARGWLGYLGYKLEWNEAQSRLSAVHPNGTTWTFWKDKQQAELNGTSIELDVAPYTSYGQLYIPLRLTAANSGFQVTWNGNGQSILLRDPNLLPSFTLLSRIDPGQPFFSEGLYEYGKKEWKLNVTFEAMESRNYIEYINVRIAAGNPADLMFLSRPFLHPDELFQSYASDLTDHIEKYPRLKAIVESQPPALRTIDGRIYGIPRPVSQHDAPFPMIRQDWLDAFGLAMPSNMDELYKAMKSISTNWPGGSAKGPVIGVTGAMPGNSLGSLSWVEQIYTGAPARFVVVDGKVEDSLISTGEREALKWLAAAYKDGLLDPQFAVKSQEEAADMLTSGQAGMAAMTLTEAANLTQQMRKDGDQKASWVPLGLKAAGGERLVPWNISGSGMYMIPRTVAGDKLEQILGWLDKGIGLTDEGAWEKLKGWTPQDQAFALNVFGQTDILPPRQQLESMDSSVRGQYKETAMAWEQAELKSKPLAKSELAFNQGEFSELISGAEMLKLEVIQGKATLSEWDAYIEKMKSSQAYKQMLDKLNSLI